MIRQIDSSFSSFGSDAGLGHGDPGHHWAADHNPHLAAMIESIDLGIGQITAKLDELGLAENTIFIFTSDTRPAVRQGPPYYATDGAGDPL